MEWLKDKKNLPVVAALAVVFFLVAGGLIAMELGLFSGGSTASAPAPSVPSSVPPMPVTPPGAPRLGQSAPGSRPGLPPTAMPGAPGRGPRLPGAPAVAAAKPPAPLNPAVGPDPFYIPGGQTKLAKIQNLTASAKLPLREAIGPLNLFQIHPPESSIGPLPSPGPSPGLGTAPATTYNLIGVVTGSDGINAILESGGQSQSVKPGDSLPDGSQVQNIQTNSLTLRTSTGSVITLPLSAGNPDQGTSTQNGPTQFNGQPYVNGQPQFPPGNNGQ